MFERYRKAKTPLTMDTFPSVTRHAAQGNMTYAEAVADMKMKGVIKPDDPRLQLNPVQIRATSARRMDELMADYQTLAKTASRSTSDAKTRTQYAAVVKAGTENLDILRQNEGRRHDVALASEFMAFRMDKADPHNPKVAQMMMLSAAACERAQRERATRGFETGNISKAAQSQGRSWIDVRDDLAKHNMLDAKDPRLKIRKADIDNQKGGTILAKNTLPAADLEDVAMKRLKKDPKDMMGTAWLATAGHLTGDKAPKKVKGAEVQGVVPAKPKLFGKTAAKRRAAGIELG
jgi:hypothetical protein